MRKIIHVDMDAFYAAIEQRDDPSLRGLPIAVGGSGPRGVVMTASYEARVFGVRSAMPTARARALCPGLLVVRPRFPTYKAASAVIREVLAGWTALVEPLSLDEAFLDVTEVASASLPAVEIARRIKQEILARTGLTASAGVSFNKFLAKLASDLEKPDGLTLIRARHAQAFIAALPVERFHGVGPATARRLQSLGITTGADLQAADPAALTERLGRIGAYLAAMAQGLDDRPVRPDRPRKSLGVETTLTADLVEPEAMLEVLGELLDELKGRALKADFAGRTLTLKLKTSDFRIRTRSRTLARADRHMAHAMPIVRHLLLQAWAPGLSVRLLGLSLTRGGPPPAAPSDQFWLLGEPAPAPSPAASDDPP